MKNILSPSILAADFTCLGEQIEGIRKGGAEYLHFDVMDGMFVPNISFGMPVLKSIRGAMEQQCDVHLMISDPIRYIEEFAGAGADIITVHIEACDDLGVVLKRIKEYGVKAGVSIKPGTAVEVLDEWLPMLDMVLVMSVEPGFGGQKFIPESLEKIKSLRRQIRARGLAVDIEVDGGIDQDNVRSVLAAGANVIVVGSSIFGRDPEVQSRQFMEILNEFD